MNISDAIGLKIEMDLVKVVLNDSLVL
jgi:hypothetical protein